VDVEQILLNRVPTLSRQTLPLRGLPAVLLCLLLVACGGGPELPHLDADAVILAFGDSLTHGNGAGKDESYPAVLQKLSSRRVINAGVSGEVSDQGVKRLPGLLRQYHPALLILCHGGNDILRKLDPAKMAANVRRMISMAKDRGIPVVLLGVPRPGLFLSSAGVYGDIADETGVIYMEDLIPDILADNSLKSDTVHPNRDGYRRMAEGIYTKLQEAGAL